MTDIVSRDVAVVLPCSVDKFSEFISNLLGRPQVIRRQFEGVFSLTIGDIENFHHLIEQRIKEQNRGSLIQFSAMIGYSDGSSIEVSSLDELKAYAEVRPLVSIWLSLTWIYIIKFHNREAPEKQEINVEISTFAPNFISRHDNPYVHKDFFRMNEGYFGTDSSGHVSLEIRHTARSWGADMEALISAHIDNFLDHSEKYRGILRSKRKYISYLTLFMSFSFLYFIGAYIALNAANIGKMKYMKSVEAIAGDIDKVHSKIDYLADYLSNGMIAVWVIGCASYLLGSSMASVVFSNFISTKCSARKPSFVLLSRKSIEYKDFALKAYEKNWRSFTAWFIANNAIGISSNAAFALLTWSFKATLP